MKVQTIKKRVSDLISRIDKNISNAGKWMDNDDPIPLWERILLFGGSMLVCGILAYIDLKRQGIIP